MSSIHITSCQLACPTSEFRVQDSQLNKVKYPSTFLGRKLPKISLKLTFSKSRYELSAPVCLFGGKDKSDNGNEASPWKAIEKAVGNFKKDQSIEDVLKQQIQKQEYYDDGGSGGNPPGGGGGGGSDGSGEAEDENMWEELTQVILATAGFVFLYIYIIEGEEINVLVKDFLKYIFRGQKSIRLRRIINQWNKFFQSMREEEYYDPYWLEREIINTPTMYDSPTKYKRIFTTALDERSESDDS